MICQVCNGELCRTAMALFDEDVPVDEQPIFCRSCRAHVRQLGDALAKAAGQIVALSARARGGVS